jgi:Fe-S oxidoreductase/nitrate reductase gamma subunit
MLTREIFGNIPSWARVLFYLFAAAAVATWAYGILARARLWLKGRCDGERTRLTAAVERFVGDVLVQRRVLRRGFASAAHVLLFSGFIVLLVGTTLIAIEHVLADLLGRTPNNPVFHKGIYFGVYEVVMDVFGVALIAGCAMFLYRRWRSVGSFARTPADVGVLVLLLVIGVSGYVLEGLRIVHAQTPLPGLSPVGYLFARIFTALGTTSEAASPLHFTLWWSHAVLALCFIALMPFTRLLHSLAGTVNLAIRDHELGVMRPVSLAEVEATGEIGVAKLADLSRRQLVELDACVSCGRCEDSCPAFEAGKPLSPRNVVQDLVAVMNAGDFSRNVHGQPIAAETLWSCTTCTACADVCPLGISPLRMITDMRRHLIGEGTLRGSPATALQKTDRAGNPWGLAPSERMSWANGLDVPLASNHAGFELLYWVGCAAAYDRRVQNVARSVVRLLKAADVKFAVLGPEERCTGESARRMGDELLFQSLAEQNVATLASHGVRRIVAHCPHCLNSLRNDYPQAGGHYEVIHHSQLLEELVREGRLILPVRDSAAPAESNSYVRPAQQKLRSADSSLTYHDPCYLARAHHIADAPRAVLASLALPVIELPRNRRQTACCGGGGGRMWFDDSIEKRVGQSRVREIASTSASTVAVSCPFCLIMLTDGLATQKPGTKVRDIAEILAEALLGPES